MITPVGFNSYEKKNRPSFGFSCSGDYGCSVVGGSGKFLVHNGGKTIDYFSKKLSPGGVTDSKDYIRKIKLGFQYIVSSSRNATKQLPKAQRKLDDIFIFIAGRPRINENGTYAIKQIRNLKGIKTKQSLQNVEFSSINKSFPHANVYVFNDMIGAAAAVLKNIKPNEIPKNGMVLTTGGGCGVSYFQKVGNDAVKISESRDGRRLLNDTPIENYGASVRALLTNFCDALKIKGDDAQRLINDGNAMVITNESPSFIKWSRLQNITLSQVNAAAKTTIDKYAEAIGQCIKLKLVDDNQDLNKIFLSGKLISGLNNYVEKQSCIWGKKKTNLEELIKEKMINGTTPNNHSKIKDLQFEILTNIKDNTEGGMFLEGKKLKVITENERNDDITSVIVPLKA